MMIAATTTGFTVMEDSATRLASCCCLGNVAWNGCADQDGGPSSDGARDDAVRV